MDAHDLDVLLDHNGSDLQHACAQIVDGEGNLITLTSEQLAQAGVDLNNMTEADVEALLGLATHSNSNTHNSANACLPNLKRKAESAPSPSKRMAIDSSSCFQTPLTRLNASAAEPCEQITDISQIDNDTLASLLNCGSVKFVDEHGNEIPASVVLDNSTEASSFFDVKSTHHRNTAGTNGSSIVDSHSCDVSQHQASATRAAPPSDSLATSFALLTSGSRVMVRRLDGVDLGPAVVRYVRPGVGYKVQFDSDNRFDWVTESQIVSLDAQPELTRCPVIESTSPMSTARLGATCTANMTTYAGRRHAQRQQPPVTQQSSLRGASGASTGPHRFMCPVCEKNIFDKEPSYIVIRLPACEGCASSKILVLDDQARRKNV